MSDRLRLVARVATAVYALHTLAVIALVYGAIFTTATILPPDPKGRREGALSVTLFLVEALGAVGLAILWGKVGERAEERAEAEADKALIEPPAPSPARVGKPTAPLTGTPLTGTSPEGHWLYLAECQDCEPIPTQPFRDRQERDRWAAAHRLTGHTVVDTTDLT